MEVVAGYFHYFLCFGSYDSEFVVAGSHYLFSVGGEVEQRGREVESVAGVETESFEVVNAHRVAVGSGDDSSASVTDHVCRLVDVQLFGLELV